jgi:dTDP-4-amino-4,6-dideoxygalactose transaminase
MLTTNDDELYERAILMKNHAIKKDENTILSYVHDVIDIGCDYNMTGIDAAYSRTIFDNLESDIKRRKEIAERYMNGLDNLPHVTLPAVTGDHTYAAFIIKIDKNRDDFAKELLKKNIETDVHYMPVHMTKYYREKYELKIMDYPIALRTYGSILSLPVYPQLSNTDVDDIINAVKAIAQSRKW